VNAGLPTEASTVRMLAGAKGLGFDGETLDRLATAWRTSDCTTARRRLVDAVTARLDVVQAEVAERQRLMADSGPGTREWAETTRSGMSLFEGVARLQAVAAALAGAHHDGPCGDACACSTALAAPITAYHFPSDSGLSCDLAADEGDAHDRIDEWQRVLARAERRDPLPDPDDPGQTGVVLRFPFDVDLAATLGRLAAAEYRCCSFGSYTIVVDGTGLRLEIRMPIEAAETVAAVVGLPDQQVEAA